MTDIPLHRLFYGRDPIPNLYNLTTSELAIAQIEGHLAHRKAHTLRDESGNLPATGLRESVPTLAELAAAKIASTLRYDTDGVRILSQNCPEKLLRGILRSPQLHFIAFRSLAQVVALAESSQGPETANLRKVGKLAIEDVDSWILRNEKYIRQIPPSQQSAMLVSLDDAVRIWPDCVVTPTAITLVRKIPPKETFTFFDEKREREVKILPSNAKFADTFHRLTSGILHGLDWDNVVVAGGMAVNTLRCVSEDMDGTFVSSDLDIYIYGLSPEEANKKVRHIYETWCKNLGPTKRKFMVKNAKTINFMSNYPERRLQVILKVLASSVEVLLNFDLDPCAIFWDGKEVLMLPRAARALETGYTIFTMDLVHGHHLGDRRATQESRVLKYADRGFGILIPASLLDTARLDFTKRRRKTTSTSMVPCPWNSRAYRPPPVIREPPEVVYGKKSVKRVAFLGEDTAHRFFLGKTRMESPISREYGDDIDSDVESWYGTYSRGASPDGPGEKKYIRASVAAMNGRTQHVAQPGGRAGVGSGFELMMRLAALFKFESQDRLKIDRDSLSSVFYGDHEVYDDPPTYEWCDSFDPEDLADSIDEHNETYHAELCHHSQDSSDGMTHGGSGNWDGCFTRPVRRMTYSEDFDEICRQQLAMPIHVPMELEQYIKNTMRNVCRDHGIDWSDEMNVLIPIHNNTPNTPPLGDVLWNIRFWVIGNITMWAKLDPRIDEIFEVLWTLFHLHYRQLADGHRPRYDREESEFTKALASQFDRRIIPASALIPKNEQVEVGSWPDAREKELFHDWLVYTPNGYNRAWSYETHHPTYREFSDWTKVPEDWYWDEERDGGTDCGNWSEWEEGKQEVENDRKRKRVDSMSDASTG